MHMYNVVALGLLWYARGPCSLANMYTCSSVHNNTECSWWILYANLPAGLIPCVQTAAVDRKLCFHFCKLSSHSLCVCVRKD